MNKQVHAQLAQYWAHCAQLKCKTYLADPDVCTTGSGCQLKDAAVRVCGAAVNACIYICLYACVCACIHIYVNVTVIDVCMYLLEPSVCVYIYTHTYTYIHIYIYIYITHVYMSWVYIYVYIYISLNAGFFVGASMDTFLIRTHRHVERCLFYGCVYSYVLGSYAYTETWTRTDVYACTSLLVILGASNVHIHTYMYVFLGSWLFCMCVHIYAYI